MLKSIPGLPPSLLQVPRGCPFHPRCDYASDRCLGEEPPMRQVAGGLDHRSACWLPPEAVGTTADVVLRRQEVARLGHPGSPVDMTSVQDESASA
jgi:hypothetical protein